MGVSVSGISRVYPITFLLFFYSPDRWDNLPETASELPGLFSNTLTFSAGPRVSCSHYLIHIVLFTLTSSRVSACDFQ
jgi:hypothetical protein